VKPAYSGSNAYQKPQSYPASSSSYNPGYQRPVASAQSYNSNFAKQKVSIYVIHSTYNI